jgi:hypothetical protein
LPRRAVWSAECWRTRRLHARALIRFVLEKVFYSEEGAFGYPMKIANNPLAVKLESENDSVRENFSADLFKDFTSIEAAAAAQTIRIS